MEGVNDLMGQLLWTSAFLEEHMQRVDKNIFIKIIKVHVT